jgi:hypothetical protein
MDSGVSVTPVGPNAAAEPTMSKSQAIAIRDRMLRGERMSWEEVRSWAGSGDVELMGAAFQALRSGDQIDGDIDGVEADRILVTYLILVVEDRGVAAEIFQMPPYVAAHELAHFYKDWRGRASPPDDGLKHIRGELSRMYLSGDERQRRRVVDGVLEHIFEDPSCLADFERWRDDPVLARAHQEAMQWIAGRP